MCVKLSHNLVTGGAGFIGSAIVRALLARGDRVRVFDNLSTGKRANLAGLSPEPELIEGDLRDTAALAKALRGIDYVFHEAAIASVPQSIAEPIENDAVNAGGSLRLLGLARAAGVRRVVYAATAAVYGDSDRLPLSESLAAQPLSPYGVSKYAGELYCRVFYHTYGLETVALRYFNVFGPRQDPNSPYSGVLSRFIQAFTQGARPTIFGDGRQTRDFVFVEDVVRANLLACHADAGAVAGNVYNIGTGSRSSLLDVVSALQKIFGRDLAPVFAEARAGDIRDSVADISSARAHLGYAPAVSLEEGLRRTVEWASVTGY